MSFSHFSALGAVGHGDIEELSLTYILDAVIPQPIQRSAHRLPLGIEHRRLQGNIDSRFHRNSIIPSCVFVSGLTFLTAFLLLAQPPAPSQTAVCAIEGQVLNAVTGEPLRKASLVLRKGEGRSDAPYAATTDAAGRFVMRPVEPGVYRLAAERNGFVRTEYGARGGSQTGAPLSLGPGQEMRNVVLKMLPHGVITGRVVDEDGESLANVNVQAMRYLYVRGRRQLVTAAGGNTNDLGEYRLFGLEPGQFYVSAMFHRPGMRWRASESTSQTEESYAATFYPGALDLAAAVAVPVSSGSEARGIDFTLTRVPTVRVSGRVMDAMPSRTGRGVMVFLYARNRASSLSNRNGSSVRGPEGTFEIRGVLPGSYIISAERFANGRRFTARQPLEVGQGGTENVNLVLGPAMDIRGRIHRDGDTPTEIGNVRVSLQPRLEPMMGGMTGTTKEDGTFVVGNVVPDEYTIAISGLKEDLYVKAVRAGDKDVLETGLDLLNGSAVNLEIVVSSAGGQILGVVADGKQQPAIGSHIALVPDERRREQAHLFKTATADQHGKFTLRGIAPGEYKLFAFEELDSGALQNPQFLKEFEKLGEAVSIRESASESATLKLISDPASGQTK